MKINPKYGRVIRQLSHALEKRYAPERIVLFGSFAMGNPHAESDIDLLIVKKTSQSFHKRLATVRRIVSPLRGGVPFDPIVVTPEELDSRLKMGDQFFAGILQSGKVLYVKTR